MHYTEKTAFQHKHFIYGNRKYKYEKLIHYIFSKGSDYAYGYLFTDP